MNALKQLDREGQKAMTLRYIFRLYNPFVHPFTQAINIF